MFTGIIEAKGSVLNFSKRKNKQTVSVLEIAVPAFILKGLKIGSSVAVNGVCLTVVKKGMRKISFDVVNETKNRTNLGELNLKDNVNLERPMKLNARGHGHFVLGHVDGVGRVQKIVLKGRQKSFLISFPKDLRKWISEKGSVALDGISLTVGKVSSNTFWAHLIPHTLKHTTTGQYCLGTRVNLEVDILAKLVLP